MMNWAVGRESINRTPFRRGTETLVRKLREDNQRRRQISEDEEARLERGETFDPTPQDPVALSICQDLSRIRPMIRPMTTSTACAKRVLTIRMIWI
jgi:hypothetical protein